MSVLPQSNAQLLSVTRGGFTEDYDEAAGSGTAVWQGNADAYVQQKIRSTFNLQGELLRVIEVTLIVGSDLLGIILEPGDIVTYVGSSNPTPQAGRIQNLVSPAELPMITDYYKCALEPVNVP